METLEPEKSRKKPFKKYIEQVFKESGKLSLPSVGFQFQRRGSL